MAFSPYLIFAYGLTFDGVSWCHVDGNMHGNYMQMRLCIVKLGIASSIYGDFGEAMGWRCTYAQSSPDWDL